MTLKASDLPVGHTHKARLVEDLKRTQIVQYAGASGDYNPLHTDEIFTTEYFGPIVGVHVFDDARYAEVVAQARDTVPRLGLVGVLDTLEHLKKGGRIGSAQALLGSMLAIKPLILVQDGKVAEGGRQRTRAKALDALAKVVTDAAPFERLAVAHGAAEDLDSLLARLAQLETDTPIIVGDIGPVVGTHGGPGVIGVCWIRRA